MKAKTKKRQSSKIAPIKVRGTNTMQPRYERARLRTPTGERYEVMCVDFQDEEIENALLEDNRFNPELRIDLTKALTALFTPLQRRVLLRVLLQGQSVRRATERMKGSNDVWERWIAKVALPALRERLSEWREDLARLGSHYVPMITGAVEPESPDETVKCRECSLKFTGKSALRQLRAHFKQDHPMTMQQVAEHVTSNDYGIQRDSLGVCEESAAQENMNDAL